MGMKRPVGETPRENTFNDVSKSMVTSKTPSVDEPPSHPMQTSLDFLERLKKIVSRDFPHLQREFDFEMLDRGIKNEYYINHEEFMTAFRQIARAVGRKFPQLDLTCKCKHPIHQ